MANKENKQLICPYASINDYDHAATQLYPKVGDDEINLVDIWFILVRQRKGIIAMTIIFSLGASIYAFVTPSVYRAEAFLLPPLAKDIAGLNVFPLTNSEDVDNQNSKDNLTSEDSFTPEKVFQQTVLNLKLRSLRRRFLEQHKDIPATVSIRPSVKNNISQGVYVSMEGGTPEDLANGVNAFVAFINASTAQNLLGLLGGKLKYAKAEIQRQITALRNKTEQRRLDRIIVLGEALAIAEKNGIVDMVINPKDSPLYLRGSKALSTEIAVLKQRKNNDAFTAGLRDLQKSLSLLSQPKIDASLLRVSIIDQPAVLPVNPVKPKRRLIIVLGVLLGTMVGVFAAFVMNFIEVARRENGLSEG